MLELSCCSHRGSVNSAWGCRAHGSLLLWGPQQHDTMWLRSISGVTGNSAPKQHRIPQCRILLLALSMSKTVSFTAGICALVQSWIRGFKMITDDSMPLLDFPCTDMLYRGCLQARSFFADISLVLCCVVIGLLLIAALHMSTESSSVNEGRFDKQHDVAGLLKACGRK